MCPVPQTRGRAHLLCHFVRSTLHQAAEKGGSLAPGGISGPGPGAAHQTQTLGQGGIAQIGGRDSGAVGIGAGEDPIQTGHGTVSGAVQQTADEVGAGEDSFLGALILAFITRALPLVGIDAIAQNMVKGILILVVVVLNVVTQRMMDRTSLERREM